VNTRSIEKLKIDILADRIAWLFLCYFVLLMLHYYAAGKK